MRLAITLMLIASLVATNIPKGLRRYVCVCVFLFQLLDQLIYFNENSLEYCAIRGHHYFLILRYIRNTNKADVRI